MGYEIKLIVGQKQTHYAGTRVDRMAEVELCGIGLSSEFAKLNPVTNKEPKDKYFFFADDGNTMVYQDKCGDWFQPLGITTIMNALKRDIALDISKGKVPYRCFDWAYELLKAMISNLSPMELKDTVVLFYGH